MARLLCGALVAAGVSAMAATPECRTPLKVPCSTIRFEHSVLQLVRDGALTYSRSRWTSVEALRSDGSSVTVTEGGEFRDWFKSEKRAAAGTHLFLAGEDQVVQIDHEKKTVLRRAPAMWDDRPYRLSTPDDRTCLSGIRHWGRHFFLRGQASVAGVEVIKWVGGNAGGGYTEVYLAPSLDCRALKTHTVFRKLGVFPTFIRTTEAVAVERGEPKAELFSIPEGYREVSEP